MIYDDPEDFKEKIKSYIEDCEIDGVDTKFSRISSHLILEVKNFFPMNEVPQHVVQTLQAMKERLKIAEEQLRITLEILLLEYEKLN